MDYIERNYHLVQQRMIEQMESSIALGRKLIDIELDTGLLNFIIKPIVKSFYDYWAQNDARDGTLRQIKVTLDSGKKLLLNGNSNEVLNDILKKNFPKYLEADQTYRQCSKQHKNYRRLKQVACETFINYLKEVVKLLDVKEDVDNYGDLCRIAFESKEIADKNLMKQLDFTEEGIKIVEEDPSILKLPIGRKIIVKALRKGFEMTKEEFIKALNDTYTQK
ncbi:MAG: hypothetical protein ACFE75_01575 [Candidatus Hodarchaeota archaeon]